MSKEPRPSGKPARPKKPHPAKEDSAKVPVPCGARAQGATLTEERVREIVREEVAKWMRAYVSRKARYSPTREMPEAYGI